MKKLQPRHYVYLLVFALIAGSYGGILALWQHERNQNKVLNQQIEQMDANQAATQGSSYNAVTIAPAEKSVYLPLAKLKLPDSALAENLVYAYTDDHTVEGIKKVFPANLSISTHDLAANAVSTTRQFDCSEVVYAEFVTPSYPVNPMWKLAGKVDLADGRTMHTYYATSIPGCDVAWKINKIDTKAIAETLQSATSY